MNRKLRQLIHREEFDYQVLLFALSRYASPNDKITRLLKNGDIIRVKKGLYVLGEHERRRPIVLEFLANLIYGPSFISGLYALGYYGLIPERSQIVTSVCLGRSKEFETPVGPFTYTHSADMSTGFTRISAGDSGFLMALPERALADILKHDRLGNISSIMEMEQFLLENLRVDEQKLFSMDAALLETLSTKLRSRKTAIAGRLVRKGSKKK
ncbi:hypothetical protein KKF84_19425 [Myxococcota bacterium]|nr:hypothetical protein [Myxococcota bacterium]MBU1537495.1 hypothetical protein [Myxococcota bacterium]